MAEYTKVALDAMGGDNAPVEIIKGAVDAVNKRRDIQLLIVGKEDIIKDELAKYTYDKEQIEIKGASEVIETAEGRRRRCTRAAARSARRRRGSSGRGR